MRLNAPKRITWKVTLIVGIVAVIGLIVSYFGVPILGIIASWLLAAALAVSLAANVVSGL
jgi:hypothetical protein